MKKLLLFLITVLIANTSLAMMHCDSSKREFLSDSEARQDITITPTELSIVTSRGEVDYYQQKYFAEVGLAEDQEVTLARLRAKALSETDLAEAGPSTSGAGAQAAVAGVKLPGAKPAVVDWPEGMFAHIETEAGMEFEQLERNRVEIYFHAENINDPNTFMLLSGEEFRRKNNNKIPTGYRSLKKPQFTFFKVWKHGWENNYRVLHASTSFGYRTNLIGHFNLPVGWFNDSMMGQALYPYLK